MARNRPRRPSDAWTTPGLDADADAIHRLVKRVQKARGIPKVSVRALAREAGLDHAIVSRLIKGEAWPEVTTVIRLERALGVRLWPDHLKPEPPEPDPQTSRPPESA